MTHFSARCCLIGLGLIPASVSLAANKVSEAVHQVLQQEQAADVLIVLPAAELDPAWQQLPFTERTTVISEALRAHAERSQAALRAELAAQGTATESLWISNSVVARLSTSQVERLAKGKQALRIESNAVVHHALEPTEQWIAAPKATQSSPPLEAHLQALNVPAAWEAGARGAGVVVAGQDTGYDWTHPALLTAYLGWNGQQADHQYHWYDAVRSAVVSGANRCGYASTAPCDDGSHGTHTMGTAVGGGVFQVGVAPEARWIGCRNMDRGNGRPSTYLGCFQFFLAPTDTAGQQPRPERAPHVMINSWACPTGAPPAGEDCQLQSFDTALANLKAAGILTVVAAGNGTPGCGSIIDPPAISADTLAIGATDNAGAIAPFSLWGPVTVDGSQRLKPDVSAPGVSIFSSTTGGGYGRSSGTSMATPAVVGVSALMLGANPLLIGQPEETGRLLKASARPALYPLNCGALSGQSSPNMVFGWGLVDAGAAVQAATSLTVTPSHSGAWFDPSRNGEGWILQILEDGRASLVWYTFAADGEADQQAWLIASNGVVDGQRIRFEQVFRVGGGKFGSAFEPSAISYSAWGTLEFTVQDCDRAEVSYQGPAQFGSGQRQISRLTALAGHRCGQPLQRSESTRERHAGAWFVPARSGEGWLLEPLAGGRAALTWFTYTPEGQPAWLFGVGTLDDNRLQIDAMLRSTGTRFGAGFDPAAIQTQPWGQLSIDFLDCQRAQLSYQAEDPNWGSGGYAVQRLSALKGLGCSM